MQFGQPPPPQFQPQPDWGGMDYYNAHAINPESSLYDHAWNGVRQYSGSPMDQGVGMHEARHWHKRAYGGLGELGLMQPAEIGHAAAYEAYRTWIHNSSIHEPLSGDIERQREGLIGLAIAEASRLLQFANRSMDTYARTAAAESAAATASIIFYHSREREEGDYHRSRSRTRHGSFSGGSSYEDDDPYASDLQAMASQFSGHRSHSRHRSHSTSSRHAPFPGSQMGGISPNLGPIPIPSNGYAAPGAYGTPYGGAPMQMQGGSSYSSTNGMPMPMQGGSSYGSTNGMPMTVGQPYGGAPPMVMPMGHRQRSTSMSMPYTQQPQYMQAQYPQVQYAPPQQQYMIPHRVAAPQQQQPTTIILGSGHGHRRHRKKSKRSRSHHDDRHRY
ncbi:hypothetical protein C8R47DRAFT_1115608 [Mycena vitilis]|nr:hypothetical protein C8R47DRAFT_1115608 [Mycena vitilis]